MALGQKKWWVRGAKVEIKGPDDTKTSDKAPKGDSKTADTMPADAKKVSKDG